MTGLNAGFAGVALPTKRLQVLQIERAFRVFPDWLDVIDFQALPGATLNTFPAVSPLCGLAQGRPAAVPQHGAIIARI